MRLLHYSYSYIDKLDDCEQANERGGPARFKPKGLWVSVEGEVDWPEWCKDNDFAGGWSHKYEITLAPDPNILYLNSVSDLDRFTKKYIAADEDYLSRMYIKWEEVAEEYNGIIIAPYQWSRRLELMWYYGWDCASGCIWRPSRAIDKMEQVRFIERELFVVPERPQILEGTFLVPKEGK